MWILFSCEITWNKMAVITCFSLICTCRHRVQKSWCFGTHQAGAHWSWLWSTQSMMGPVTHLPRLALPLFPPIPIQQGNFSSWWRRPGTSSPSVPMAPLRPSSNGISLAIIFCLPCHVSADFHPLMKKSQYDQHESVCRSYSCLHFAILIFQRIEYLLPWKVRWYLPEVSGIFQVVQQCFSAFS